MSDYRFPFPACVTAGKGRIDCHDVILLRRHMCPEGVTSREQAHMLISLHRECPVQCAEWRTFLTEQVAAYLVLREEPAGCIDANKAAWLIDLCQNEGAVSTAPELAMILHALDLSSATHESLNMFVLDQVRRSLLPQLGCAHAHCSPPAAAVTAYDLGLIWRVLAPAVDRGSLNLGPGEAALLAQINLLTDPSQNHPLWNEMMANIVTIESPADILRALSSAMAAPDRASGGAAA
jgi:hypothetical protein